MTEVQIFNSQSLQQEMKHDPIEYLEFLKVPALTSGIYHLRQGTQDPQPVHEEDEIYYVLSGKASFNSENGSHAIEQGSIIYVAAKAEHKFIDITEDLTLLVFFAENQITKQAE